MAEPEFTATGVRIGRRLRSLTRAGQVRIADGRLELLTSYGTEIDSAPVQAVRAGKPWFAPEDRALAEVNGTRYRLTLGEREPARPGRAPDRAQVHRGGTRRRGTPRARLNGSSPGRTGRSAARELHARSPWVTLVSHHSGFTGDDAANQPAAGTQ
ncbi:hypothetical protein SALBM135S_09444 [Streptomyces alboniger]